MSSLDVPNHTRHATYAQHYFMDSSTEATEKRLQHPENGGMDSHLLKDKVDYIKDNNHYARILINAHERRPEAEVAGEVLRAVKLVFNGE